MELHIDLPWLLEIQERRVDELSVRDYSALEAAIARHRTRIPKLGVAPDNAWRAAALLHTIVVLRPLPADNALYGSMIAVAYMDAAGEGLNPPYGGLIDLCRDVISGKADVYGAADRIRSWRI